jgi:hypothetical protein
MSLKQTVRIKVSEGYRGIKEFKKGYQPKTNLVKYENDDLLANSLNILNSMKNYFCHLLNVHGVNDVRQTEMHIVESSVPEASCFKAETAIEKLKRYKSPGTDQIPAELFQAGGNISHSLTYELINSTWNKKELPQQQESIIIPMYKKG